MARHIDIYCNGNALTAAVPTALLQNVVEDTAQVDIETSPRAGVFGQFIDTAQRRSLVVHVDFAIRELYDLSKRAQAQTWAAKWAQDGYLTVSYRPYQRLRVTVSQRPTLLSVRNYAQAFRASFTAYSVPYWQDSGVTTQTLTGTDKTGTITPTGTLGKLPTAVTVTHSSGTLTTLTLTAGSTQMAFTDLSVAAGTALTIAYDDDYNLTIKAGTTGVMSARTAASSDHLLLTPGVENTIRVQADVSVSAEFSVRGLYL